MLFVLAKFVWALLRPSSVLLLLCVFGTLLHRRRWGFRALILGVSGFVAVAVIPVDRWLMAPLEERFPRMPAPAHVDGIIVLGGGVDTARTLEHGIPALTAAAERMTAFAGLSRRYPEARLVFTGGSGALFENGLTEAEVARMLFTELGIPPARVVYEDQSRTTFENAVLTRRLVNPQPGEVWLLVTSANHMPRAVGVFRHVGWPVMPWPVAYKTPPMGDDIQFGPLGDHLVGVDLAVHEWAGLVAYYVTGRTETLFPAPTPIQ